MNEAELKPRFEDEFPDTNSKVSEQGEALYESGQINATQAGYVEGASGQAQNVATSQDDANKESGYPGNNPYKSKTNNGRHPIAPSQRIRTVGDANSGDPHLR